MSALPPIEIRIEVETRLPSGDLATYVTPIQFNGDIVNWTAAKQARSIKKVWRSMPKKKGARLIAFHVPVTEWRRLII